MITVLTESVSDRYLEFLQSTGVSYLFGGKTRINLTSVLRKLRAKFGIRKLLLGGGGKINGSFLAANVIDELSILVAPVADGSVGTPSLFDVANRRSPGRNFRLKSIERLIFPMRGSGINEDDDIACPHPNYLRRRPCRILRVSLLRRAPRRSQRSNSPDRKRP